MVGKIGIIGGSGLYKLEGIEGIEEISLLTPFGEPSDKFILGKFHGKDVVFLPRHGRSHTVNPSHINYRANIYGMKKLGVQWLISVTACGSLKEELKPLDFIIPTQFVDRTTKGRVNTFFDEGIVVHVSFAHPVCMDLASLVYKAAQEKKMSVHFGGTYLNMEGPQFSTLAESNLYRSWGMDIIGMTNMTEARLAREAEICYVTLAAVTDYDCWYSQGESVTVELVIQNLLRNVENAKRILEVLIPMIPEERNCECKDALRDAIVTRPQFISEEVRARLDIIIGKYIK